MALVSANFSILPEDVLLEILPRLPVKALIRFKSVCRRWYDLISNPNFISTHLKINSTKRVRCDDDHENFCGLKVVAFDVVNGRQPDSVYDYLHLNLNVDFDMKETPLDVFGYCDGIFCLSTTPITDRPVRDGDRNPPPTIVLHNPALRETMVLPPSHPPKQRYLCYDVGFGFDQKTKDYVVVKMVTFVSRTKDGDKTDTVLEVYSLNTDSWRVLDNAVRDFDPNANSTMDFSSGILFWYFSYPFSLDEVVVLFYTDEEMLRMRLRLPASLHPTFGSVLPSVLNRKLALMHSDVVVDTDVDGHVNERTRVDIWVISNSGDVEKPWSIAFTVEWLAAVRRVLGFWNTNVIMMYDYYSRSPILYDLITKQSMDLQLCGELDFFYKESLVSVKRTTTL